MLHHATARHPLPLLAGRVLSTLLSCGGLGSVALAQQDAQCPQHQRRGDPQNRRPERRIGQKLEQLGHGFPL